MSASQPAVVTLPPREAYRLWAPGYQQENAITTLEDAAVRQLTPPLAGRTLLDVGCGTGRRLHTGGAPPKRAVGVDLVFEMLTAARSARAAPTRVIAADLRALPLSAAAFDVVWCRLVLGHLPDLDAAYRELARVAQPGSSLIVSDFHPAAVAAGHTRTFRDAAGTLHAVEHHVHSPVRHVFAAARAGWRCTTGSEPTVGPEVRSFYESAGKLDRYEAQHGLPLVLVLAFQR